MLYEFKNSNYYNFNVFEDNKLAPRAYFIPFKDKETCDETTYLNERYNSKLVTNLNGKWDFKYFLNNDEMPKNIDSWNFDFDTIDVPSCWQFQGYEKPFYVNSRYQFDCKPPYIPVSTGTCGKNIKLDIDQKEPVVVNNSVGIYRKKVKITHAKKHILTFLGVASSLELYVNGRYVGYTEGSHNTSEFDITPFIFDGTNEIVCLVYKWCNGSYLECQDMFRNNGIFRDVYMTNYDDEYIYDYSIKTKNIEEEKYRIDIKVTACIDEKSKLVYELYYGKKLVSSNETPKEFSIEMDKPYLWSAETPNLYTLYLMIKKGNKITYCVRQEVGIKTVEIVNSVFYFNKKPIILKGVNHHDTSPKTGYTMTIDELEQDVKLMKLLNVNSVRTAHYPPDPVFLKLANYYGLYIVDEADIETHGTYNKTIPLPNLISNNKKWQSHYWDRVYRMYERDKNNACVTMWSLGNESGGYKNQDYCYDKLKQLDPSIPIHYEGVIRTPRWCYDVISQMYTSSEDLEKIRDHKMPAKYYKAPFFLCEYAHAMGVGPGSLDKYVELFNTIETSMGGCIWEWADHAILEEDGNYLYGGDFGEYVHDSNFCADGIVYPDRSLSTSSYVMANAYRPIKVSYISNNKYSMYNTNYFATTKNILFKWEYTQNGEVLSSGKFEAKIPPRKECVVTLDHPLLDTSKDCFLNIYYIDKPTNFEIAREQISLCQSVDKLSPIKADNVVCIEENNNIIVATNTGRVVFDKEQGKLISYCIDDIEFINQAEDTKAFIPNIFKPLIDNYMFIKGAWKKVGLDKARVEVKNITSTKEQSHVVIAIEYRIFLKEEVKYLCTVEYSIFGNGIVDVKTTLDIKKDYDIPRFGLTVEMPSEFNKIEYYGRGDKENYQDMNVHTIIGINNVDVDKMYENYIMPQDNGNRSDVRWVKFMNEKGIGLKFIADEKVLNFNANNYTDENIESAKHINELKKEDKTIIRLDTFVRGIGSNSCGPDARVEFRYRSNDTIEYKFRIEPCVK